MFVEAKFGSTLCHFPLARVSPILFYFSLHLPQLPHNSLVLNTSHTNLASTLPPLSSTIHSFMRCHNVWKQWRQCGGKVFLFPTHLQVVEPKLWRMYAKNKSIRVRARGILPSISPSLAHTPACPTLIPAWEEK